MALVLDEISYYSNFKQLQIELQNEKFLFSCISEGIMPEGLRYKINLARDVQQCSESAILRREETIYSSKQVLMFTFNYLYIFLKDPYINIIPRHTKTKYARKWQFWQSIGLQFSLFSLKIFLIGALLQSVRCDQGGNTENLSMTNW